MSRKKNIISKGLELFNTKGFASVSLKEIAKQMGISDGNVRYYFRTKEDLAIAILQDMQEELETLMQAFNQGNYDHPPVFLKSFFTQSYQVIYTYRCLYLDQVWLHHHFPEYRSQFQTYVDQWRKVFLETFERFRSENIFTNTYSDQQYQHLFEQLYIYSDSWILYYQQAENPTIEYYVELGMSILVPYWNKN